MHAIPGVPREGVAVRTLQSCVIVCGLHRSGTSAVTRLVNLLGADIADDLLRKDANNSLGYWEPAAVVAIHDRLLKAIDVTRDGLFDPLPLRSDWLATAAAREAKSQLTRIIETEFATSRLFVVKDPRISRLLPLWTELLQGSGIAPIVVIPFRNPLEVAASLAQRDHVQFPKSLLLYLYAYLEIELTSRHLPRIFVRYDHLLQDWRPFAQRLVQAFDGGFSAPSKEIAMAIDEFLTTDLYHHRFSREEMVRHPQIPPETVCLFDRMDETANNGDERALRTSFDRLRADVDLTTRLYRGYLEGLRRQLLEVRESFESSTSWRISAPVRWLSRRLKWALRRRRRRNAMTNWHI